MTVFPVLQTFEKDQTKINFTINQLSKGLTGLSATPISALDFDVDPSGANSSSTGIQTAINQASVAGGDIVFPPGTYVLTSTPAIGNGTSSAESTTRPVRLRGLGLPAHVGGLGFANAVSAVRFVWAGGASAMLKISGPLQGWAIENIEFDAASTATICLQLSAASYGECANLVFRSPASAGLFATAYGSFTLASGFVANSMHNTFRNTVVNLTAAASKGVVLSGQLATAGGNANANSCYHTFINTSVTYSGAAASNAFGLYLQATDSNTFITTHFFGGSAGTANVTFDYTVTPAWPSNQLFYGIDPSGAAVAFQNSGTPSGAFANRVLGFIDGNGATVPRIANLYNVDTTRSTAFTLTATGATQGTAAPLVADTTVVSSVAAGTGVILTALLGTEQRVYNAGANNLKIYPPVGALIDALGTNNPFTLVPGKQQIFTCWAPTVYESQTAGNMG